MSIDLNQLIMGLQGTPIKVNGEPLTVQRGLEISLQGAKSTDVASIMSTANLAQRIVSPNGEGIHLTSEQATRLKEIVAQGSTFNDIIKAQLILAVDPAVGKEI